MTSATEKELTALHKKVAEVMLQGLEQQSVAAGMLKQIDALDIEDPDAVKEIMFDIKHFLWKVAEINPAFIQAVTKFLRDNDITAEVDSDQALTGLQHKLANKNRISVGNVTALYDPE